MRRLQPFLRKTMLGLMALSCCLPLFGQVTQKVVLQEEDGTAQGAVTALTPLSALFKPPVTRVVLASRERQWVYGSAGTQALVSPDDFVHEDGSPVTGSVEFVMTEVTKKSELILGNLPTSSNGRLLETGGVVKLEAYSEGQPLKLAPSKQIPISFPDGKRVGMQVFQGVPTSEKGMNWLPIGDFPRQPTPTSEWGWNSGKEGYRMDYRYVIANAELLKSISPFMDYGKVNADQLRFEGKSKSLVAYILEQLETYYPCTGTGSFVLHVRFDDSGIAYSIGTEKNENRCLTMALQEIVARLRWQSPLRRYEATIQVERNSRGPVPASESPFVSIADHPGMQLDKTTTAAFHAIMRSVEEREEEQMQHLFVQNALKVTALQWINCDRFVNLKEVVNMAVAFPEPGFVVTTFLVFNELSSIMRGIRDAKGDITFDRIPDKMKAKVVTIGYDADNHYYIHIMPVVTQSGNAGKVSLQVVTQDALVKALAAL